MLTRKHFQVLLENLGPLNDKAGLVDQDTLHTINNCELTARQMAQESSDERFNRMSLTAWNAVSTMLAYIKAKTAGSEELEEVNAEEDRITVSLTLGSSGCNSTVPLFSGRIKDLEELEAKRQAEYLRKTKRQEARTSAREASNARG